MRLRVVAPLAAVAIAGAAIAVMVMPSASASTCVTAWSATAVYTNGMTASYNGHNYTAKWWTQNENPATNGSGVWTDDGVCGTSTDPTTPPTGDCNYAAWVQGKNYVTGDIVKYTDGKFYIAEHDNPGYDPTISTWYWDPYTCTGPTQPPTTTPPTSGSPTTSPTTPPTTNPPPSGGKKLIGYFAEWGVYGRNYHVKNIETSGSAAKLTHILYAFGNVTNGQCAIGDSYADYDKAYTAADSVDGVADTWDAGALRGSFGQLRKLKKLHPGLKVIWSFGGWTWSGGFPQAAANASSFADSCYKLVEDPRWADVFDGIDIDWEYPNACGLSCDTTSGTSGYKNLMAALRSKFGSGLVTSAITADGTSGGKIDKADYAGAAQYVDWYMPMTYDYFGAFNPQGPTAPHSPLTDFSGIPTPGFYADAAIQKLKSKGIPASKLLLGVGFYGRGWTGVTQEAPGGSATGAAPGTYEAGIEDYKVLKSKCAANKTVAGTAYGKCGSEWWSYDTPSTIGGKMQYVNSQGMGGSFFWEFSGDTSNGELISAIKSGLG